MHLFSLLPLLAPMLALIWVILRWLIWRDSKFFGFALGVLLSAPLVFFLVAYADFVWLWAGQGYFGYLIAAFIVQIAGALVGAKLQRDRERRKRLRGRGERDPAYYYIDE